VDWRYLRNTQYCDQCERLFTEFRGGAKVGVAVICGRVWLDPACGADAPIEFGALMETKIVTAGGAAIDERRSEYRSKSLAAGLSFRKHRETRPARYMRRRGQA
jgi:hypothetical protein